MSIEQVDDVLTGLTVDEQQELLYSVRWIRQRIMNCSVDAGRRSSSRKPQSSSAVESPIATIGAALVKQLGKALMDQYQRASVDDSDGVLDAADDDDDDEELD